MVAMIWNRHFLHLAVILALWMTGWASCVEDQNKVSTKKYLVFPSARFVAGQDTDPTYPTCPESEHPLVCGDVCCGEGFPFACSSQGLCYATQPAQQCPDSWVACTNQDVLITGVDPNDLGLKYGESAQVVVSFRRWNDVDLKKLVISLVGIDGEFEQDLTQEQINAGHVETVVEILDHAPNLDLCEQACSRSRACGPCYTETSLPGWLVRFMLVSSNGTALGTMLDSLNLSWKESGTSNGQCNDGTECCTTNPDCGGGISCQVVGITTPETCDCPPGTTYQDTDVQYHVKQCSCDACSGL